MKKKKSRKKSLHQLTTMHKWSITHNHTCHVIVHRKRKKTTSIKRSQTQATKSLNKISTTKFHFSTSTFLLFFVYSIAIIFFIFCRKDGNEHQLFFQLDEIQYFWFSLLVSTRKLDCRIHQSNSLLKREENYLEIEESLKIKIKKIENNPDIPPLSLSLISSMGTIVIKTKEKWNGNVEGKRRNCKICTFFYSQIQAENFLHIFFFNSIELVSNVHQEKRNYFLSNQYRIQFVLFFRKQQNLNGVKSETFRVDVIEQI